MIAKTFSATVLGIDAYLIEVEVDVSVGMSVFNIVGLPDIQLRKAGIGSCLQSTIQDTVSLSGEWW